MPIYEYVAVEDGTVLELLRPMKDADLKVEDPEHKGRKFVRRLSTFGLGGTSADATATSHSTHVHSGGCGCGKPNGGCGRG
ncbi:MAG: zinc ribbon domain-containing protein [Phycisphaerales bacterium]|nr:zinc ribbon domain-containing protein [Phycisphaerales bacterium]